MTMYRQCCSICDECADAINDENEGRIALRARIAELESKVERLRERCVRWCVRYGEQRVEAEQLWGLLRTNHELRQQLVQSARRLLTEGNENDETVERLRGLLRRSHAALVHGLRGDEDLLLDIEAEFPIFDLDE